MNFNHIELLNVEEGYDILIETAKLAEGITLKVYDRKEAELVIEGGSEKVEMPFNWSAETRNMLEKLGEMKAIDLLGLIRNYRVVV
ncbi:hypothetical protein J2Z23_000190 [Lederbergia galactosidilyticus]|uniref:hypothetical protein n=1 Tax=Lederbergia galactosidilytica TaxID=217031 RepID=UPI001AE172C0|nr:hypothetical protein [Lederbergia galactosidilytica]MBP1913258.1 hypothetical protein [Lederbergia galactosidilytica]